MNHPIQQILATPNELARRDGCSRTTVVRQLKRANIVPTAYLKAGRVLLPLFPLPADLESAPARTIHTSAC
jgi:hypothetical protein